MIAKLPWNGHTVLIKPSGLRLGVKISAGVSGLKKKQPRQFFGLSVLLARDM
jgi:hypothetical protein